MLSELILSLSLSFRSNSFIDRPVGFVGKKRRVAFAGERRLSTVEHRHRPLLPGTYARRQVPRKFKPTAAIQAPQSVGPADRGERLWNDRDGFCPSLETVMRMGRDCNQNVGSFR